jgi:hypothetical protein
MRYLEVEETIVDLDDIIMLTKNIDEYEESFKGKETITHTSYKLRIRFRYQTKYEQYIEFKTHDDLDKAYDYIKKLLLNK